MSSALNCQAPDHLIDVATPPPGYLKNTCLPVQASRMPCLLPAFEEARSDLMKDYPRSDWDDLLDQNVSLERLIQWIHNQKQEGTCASNALDATYEVCSSMTLGMQTTMMMSPIATYRWIASGPGTGSVISDNIEQITKVGTLPVDTPENRAKLKAMGLNENHVLQHTGYYQKFPEGWEDTAAHFRLDPDGTFLAKTFEGCVTGLLNDYALLYGRAGHAICGVTVVKRNGVYCLKYANSWDKWGEVGDNGLQMFGYDTESFVKGSITSYGAILVKSILVTPALLTRF